MLTILPLDLWLDFSACYVTDGLELNCEIKRCCLLRKVYFTFALFFYVWIGCYGGGLYRWGGRILRPDRLR